MAYTNKHISLDTETVELLEGLSQRLKRSQSDVVRDALWQYARREGDAEGRQAAKTAVHAAIDRAAGAWVSGSHPETLTPETYRRWREKLWEGCPRFADETEGTSR